MAIDSSHFDNDAGHDEPSGVGAVVTFIVAGLSVLAAVASLYVQPKFEEIFQDFDVELPAITASFIQNPYLFPAVMLGVGMLSVGKHILIRPSRGRWLADTILVMAVLLLFGAWIMAMYQPLTGLLEGVSGP